MEEYIELSYKLSENSPLYGDTPPIEITPDRELSKKDTCNTYILKLHNHSGTHIDGPKHFSKNGKTIAEYNPEQLIFNSPLIIDCPKKPKEMIVKNDLKEKKLNKCDILIFRTGFWKQRKQETYRTQNPGMTKELATLIRKKYSNIRCIGLDSISVSSYSNRQIGREVHRILLRKNNFKSEPILIIEDMDLSYENLKRLKRIIVSPLRVKDIDSAPCYIIGELK